jgi:ligand-binding sensor domain-containing protein
MIELLKLGGEGTGAGRFKDNRHVAVDGRGRIYSSDYSPFRIQVFQPDGSILTQWSAPSGTNLYDLVADREGNLFIANDKGVFKFEGETGKLLASATNVIARGITLT